MCDDRDPPSLSNGKWRNGVSLPPYCDSIPMERARPTRRITFTSTLHRAYQHELEQLLYFNDNQAKVRNAILSTMERYGTPRISLPNDQLWVTFDSGMQGQTLFVLDQVETNAQLVGVVVYTRENDTLVVLFIAVRGDFTQRGVHADEMLFFRILDEVRSIAGRVKGIDSVKLLFPIHLKIGCLRASR